MKTKISFGNNVKKIRISKNLTQEQLSEMIEIDLRQLARIESGNSFVTAETLEKICITLQIQPKDLFDYDLLNNKKSNEFIELEKKYNQIDLNIRKNIKTELEFDFINLAIKSLKQSRSLEKLKNIITGIELMHNNKF